MENNDNAKVVERDREKERERGVKMSIIAGLL